MSGIDRVGSIGSVGKIVSASRIARVARVGKDGSIGGGDCVNSNCGCMVCHGSRPADHDQTIRACTDYEIHR